MVFWIVVIHLLFTSCLVSRIQLFWCWLCCEDGVLLYVREHADAWTTQFESRQISSHKVLLPHLSIYLPNRERGMLCYVLFYFPFLLLTSYLQFNPFHHVFLLYRLRLREDKCWLGKGLTLLSHIMRSTRINQKPTVLLFFYFSHNNFCQSSFFSSLWICLLG